MSEQKRSPKTFAVILPKLGIAYTWICLTREWLVESQTVTGVVMNVSEKYPRPEPTSSTPIIMGAETPRIVFVFLYIVMLLLLGLAVYLVYVGVTTGGLHW